MPCSLADEERSFRKLRDLADRALPFNHRISDDHQRRVAQGVLDNIPDLYATPWKEYYQQFEKQLKKDYERWRLWFEQEHCGGRMKYCEFSAPSPGLTIACELPQSGIVGWGFTYFLQDNGRSSDHVRIGYAARDPIGRGNTFLTGNTSDLCLLGVLNSPASFEKLLHRRYAKHRIRGEWYSVTCGWNEFADDDYDRKILRDEMILEALLKRPLSAVFTADEYHGWLLYNRLLNGE